jgi:hypothetical protein
LKKQGGSGVKFTFDEWKKIRHGLETAMKSFEDEVKDGNPSEDDRASEQNQKRKRIHSLK